MASQTRAAIAASSSAKTQTAPALRQRSNAAFFEYTGKTGMTVMGPVTGATYRFPTPGSRVAVDLRDYGHVARVPNLARVQGL
jgi:hypothetical protein